MTEQKAARIIGFTVKTLAGAFCIAWFGWKMFAVLILRDFGNNVYQQNK